MLSASCFCCTFFHRQFALQLLHISADFMIHDLRIDLRGFDTGMPHHFRNAFNRNAIV